MEKFEHLKLSKTLLIAIEKKGFREPTEIQEKAIPLVLEGKDIVASSATGSGKTLAFAAGIIDKVKHSEGIQALILTPTRELAEQVGQSLKSFSQNGLKISIVYGGTSFNRQIDSLRRANIVVGTPGRILDHIGQETIDLSETKFLVLDEADIMLDMGFIKSVEEIIRNCPKERQTLLFSATMSDEVRELTHRYMKKPVQIKVDSYVDPSKLKQIFYTVPSEIKFSLMTHLLKNEQTGMAMVFCNTRRRVDKLTKNLRQYGVRALAIHGGLSQNKRNDTLEAFHSRKSLILVCTDVAARGLDIKNVSHIYNYDLPRNSKEYIHRIGRTARAGSEGMAISLVSSEDKEYFREIRKDESLNIENRVTPQLEKLTSDMKSSSPSQGNRMSMRRKPGRNSRKDRPTRRNNTDGDRKNNTSGRVRSWNKSKSNTKSKSRFNNRSPKSRRR
jgi:ATP-dependent RNA helicase DeaD